MIRHEPTGRRTAVDGRDAMVFERILGVGLDAATALVAESAGRAQWAGPLGVPRRHEAAAGGELPPELPAQARFSTLEPRGDGVRRGLDIDGAPRLELALAAISPERTALRLARFVDDAEPGALAGIDAVAVDWEHALDRLELAAAGENPDGASRERGGYEELRRSYGDAFGVRGDSEAAAVVEGAEASGKTAPEPPARA